MNIFEYSEVVRKLRYFFQDKLGFVEIPAQSRQSILAACEDPKTIAQYIFNGTNWPLPQTGQMWLEHEILRNSDVNGVFCITTSYRNEPFPIEGRHDKIFPMFEFESKGTIIDLKKLEKDLLQFIGFDEMKDISYTEACNLFGVNILDDKEEELIYKNIGESVSLEYFPQDTHPFWNMKQNEDNNLLYNKIDVILCGMETIGSAERSTDVGSMRNNFNTISNGEYAKLLYSHFGKERVEKELEEYFSIPMFPRFGGGIGVTRLIRAMKIKKII